MITQILDKVIEHAASDDQRKKLTERFFKPIANDMLYEVRWLIHAFQAATEFMMVNTILLVWLLYLALKTTTTTMPSDMCTAFSG